MGEPSLDDRLRLTSDDVIAELGPPGFPTLRALLLRRQAGLGLEQRLALLRGGAIVLPAEWLASHYLEGSHPAFPASLVAAPAWRLEADGDTLTPVVP